MSDLRDLIQQRVADGVTVAAAPATGAIWWYLDKFEFLFRLGVSAGTFVLICFAIRVKMKQGNKP